MSQSARGLFSPILICGLVGCIIGGIAGAGIFIFATWQDAVWQSQYGAQVAFYAFVAACVVSMPLNLILLPMAWASFIRSPHRNLIVNTVGVMGGGLTLAYVVAQPGMTFRLLSPTEVGVLALVGGMIGLTSAQLFTRLVD